MKEANLQHVPTDMVRVNRALLVFIGLAG